jgi:hypothetical protein
VITFLPGKHEFAAGGGVRLAADHTCVIKDHIFSEEESD